MQRTKLAIVVLGLSLLGHGTAHAQSVSPEPRARALVSVDSPRLTVAAALCVGLGIALSLGAPQPPPRWGGNPFDDAVRDGLRVRDTDARHAVGLASDFLVLGLVAYTALVDGLAMPLSQDGPDAAWRSTAAYALVIGVTLTLDELVKDAAARSRPLEPGCDTSPLPAHCTALTRGMSFYSGHAATSFASAGFSCAMHLGRSLYGDTATDGTACGASLLAATAIGLFRVMADQHYLTDVLVGAIVGFATGYLIPILLIPERRPLADRTSAADPSVFVLPAATLGSTGVDSIGLNALGAF